MIVIIIKITGILLVSLSSCMTGIFIASKIKFHINDLQEIISALKILKSEIEFGTRTLDESCKNIFNYVSQTQQNICIAKFFLKFSQYLNSKSYPSAAEAWIEALNYLKLKTNLDNEDIILLKSFADNIQSYDCKLQLDNLDILCERIKDKVMYLSNKYQNEKKLFHNLGFLIGLLIVIFFI
jgi:stage III sporulation protein AB